LFTLRAASLTLKSGSFKIFPLSLVRVNKNDITSTQPRPNLDPTLTQPQRTETAKDSHLNQYAYAPAIPLSMLISVRLRSETTKTALKMLPTTIHEAPALEFFTALADHQSQTPTTFFDAKPVLHYHYADGRVLVSQDSASRLPMFSQAAEGNTDTSAVAAAIYISSE